MARAIHRLSPAKNGPFIPQSTAQPSPRASSSRAVGPRAGRVHGRHPRQARALRAGSADGTLFLERDRRLPLAMQSKISGLIQERQFRSGWGARVHRADVRIMRRTHHRTWKSLAPEVQGSPLGPLLPSPRAFGARSSGSGSSKPRRPCPSRRARTCICKAVGRSRARATTTWNSHLEGLWEEVVGSAR